MNELKTYRCHKTVDALPMSRGEYNLYRQWQIPENENPNDDGYLVVYRKGQPDEYESWSPKDAFDEGYQEVGQYRAVPQSHIQILMDALEFEFTVVANSTTTACWAFLPLPNGRRFNVAYGESACVDPANFNKQLGRDYARQQARTRALSKLWEFEGYLLAVMGSISDTSHLFNVDDLLTENSRIPL